MNLSCALVFLFVVNIVSGYTICRGSICRETEDQTRNIVSGVPINAAGDFPYLVALLYHNGVLACGGSILNKRYILTAAHCFQSEDKPFSIQYGKVEIDPIGSNIVPIKHVIIHEHYVDNDFLVHDIALIELEEDIIFGENASPVSLPYQNEVIPESNHMLLMGWGRTRYTDPTVKHGRYTTVSKFNDAYCSERVSKINLKYQYCGGSMVDDRAACKGDSGGPVVINGKQYGIVSGREISKICGTPEYPEYYTRVPAYIDWINRYIEV